MSQTRRASREFIRDSRQLVSQRPGGRDPVGLCPEFTVCSGRAVVSDEANENIVVCLEVDLEKVAHRRPLQIDMEEVAGRCRFVRIMDEYDIYPTLVWRVILLNCIMPARRSHALDEEPCWSRTRRQIHSAQKIALQTQDNKNGNEKQNQIIRHRLMLRRTCVPEQVHKISSLTPT